jgi:hypothetical protein
MGRPRKFPFDMRKSKAPDEIHPLLSQMEDMVYHQVGEKRGEVGCVICLQNWSVPICWIRKGQPVLLRELTAHRRACFLKSMIPSLEEKPLDVVTRRGDGSEY